MIKLFYILIYGTLGLMVAEVVPDVPLAIEQWVAFSLWTILMISIAAVSIKAFTSIWLLDGFSGLNKILEDHEAIKFLASIMSFIFLEIFIALIATEFSGKYPHPPYELSLAFSGCVGSGGVALAQKIREIIKSEKDNAS